ncbi:PVC-type heme-binding CxxCH protein [Gimesia panareensis]|uniref:PVC-type heme-binding CxxCH protein n=1 Tax=Gimesia panareensis TaxID=2527978 RepID=UPI00118BF445|nr:PVC-type heme-binding CxxCH protein [Gimesia panareensis]QDU48093.1 Cytochrome c [Gimesia panareensis]
MNYRWLAIIPALFLSTVVNTAPLSAQSEHDAKQAVPNLTVAPGLKATLFTSEPRISSPSSMDVDAQGRVWICEVVNYRAGLRNIPTRKEGDRIVILEDTNGDGKADESKVFYQGNDINGCQGICVLGNKVIVAASPNVFLFTDEDNDGKADKKEVLFKVAGGEHDHSAHTSVFGPDGLLYWNFGNAGKQVFDAEGKPILERDGRPVLDNGKPYWGGMVFRCNLDGSDFEVLAHNFRNNYEVTVDSFGTMWQSDNDDDGNRGVRINYVMEFGNYGYLDQLTGARWKTPRTGMHEEIPLRHWHLRDPGVVPNLLQTGAGSPTGICIYEGSLLPEKYRNEIIHSDAGPNVVRAYQVKKDGAGYEAEIANILTSEKDKWFRPSDVCVAPDGSLFVADWYDPGVGGHRIGDQERGRIFRIAPPDAKYQFQKLDLSTVEGAIAGIKSPNLATRYLAWNKLHELQEEALPQLEELYQSDNQRFRARALWLLAGIKGKANDYVSLAVKDENPDIRITGLRAARRYKLDVIPVVKQLSHDKSPQVRRECAIALHHSKSPQAPELWVSLVDQYDGKDRWYLEALGIGMDEQEQKFLSAWLKQAGDNWNTPVGRDLLWRSKIPLAIPYLVKIIEDPQTKQAALPRYFRTLDFIPGKEKNEAVAELALFKEGGNKKRETYIIAEALSRMSANVVTGDQKYQQALNQVIDSSRGTPEFIKLVEKFKAKDYYPELVELGSHSGKSQTAVDAIRAALSLKQNGLIRKALASKGDNEKEQNQKLDLIWALGNSSHNGANKILLSIIQDQQEPLVDRREAVRAITKSRAGAHAFLDLAEKGKIAPQLEQTAAAAMSSTIMKDVKERAAKLFPAPPTKNNKPLPPINVLAGMKGDVVDGRVMFNTKGTCAKCHVVNGMGKEVGPNLSEIGKKLSREALFESILYPSAGISHNFEAYTVVLVSGNVVNGLLVNKTDDAITLKDAEAISRTFKMDDVEEVIQQKISLMPADLQKVLTQEELINIVEYLTTLKQAKPIKKASL